MGGKQFIPLLLAVVLVTLGTTYGFFLVQEGEPEGVIVQMFQWGFVDIARECEKHLGPKGYAGVQVSPITESVILSKRPWYERYQPASYQIISPSGSERQFKDMVRRCNAVRVKVYVEVVLNNMAKSYKVPVRTYGGSFFDLPSYNYSAVPYEKKHFHEPCQITDENDEKQIRNCEVDGLHDLDQSNYDVRCVMGEFLNKLIEYGVAGFCIDSAKHMWPKHLKELNTRLNFLNKYEGFAFLTPPFIYQELNEGGPIKAKDYFETGHVTDYKFAIDVSQVFLSKKNVDVLKQIVLGEEGSPFVNGSHSVVFIDNHLTERGLAIGKETVLTYKQEKEYKLALVFLLATPHGAPRIMSSYAFKKPEQGPPTVVLGFSRNVKVGKVQCGDEWICQHRWKEISNMVDFRRLSLGESASNWWDNGKDAFAFSRGSQAFIAFNLNQNDKIEHREFKTGMEQGEYCDAVNGELNFMGFCNGKVVSVNEKGMAKFSVDKMSAVALHPGMKIPWKHTSPAIVYSAVRNAVSDRLYGKS